MVLSGIHRALGSNLSAERKKQGEGEGVRGGGRGEGGQRKGGKEERKADTEQQVKVSTPAVLLQAV